MPFEVMKNESCANSNYRKGNRSVGIYHKYTEVN